MSYIMFPKNIQIKDHNVYIDRETVRNEESFALLVPENKSDMIIHYLKSHRGFSNANPSFDHGEDYGISKIIKPPWELHIRLYVDSYFYGYSKMLAHIEIARKYLQHLNFKYVQPVIYEPFRYYKSVFDEFMLAYSSRFMVESIVDNYWFRLINPESLIPWSPVALAKTSINIISDKLKKYFGNSEDQSE
ncbi:hypothetical protein [Ferroplasma sp.]|uniref:hypothetical protein n=1 Tax=Ferroplasma sp. TaxID=2591003 RepID=UPI00307E7292